MSDLGDWRKHLGQVQSNLPFSCQSSNFFLINTRYTSHYAGFPPIIPALFFVPGVPYYSKNYASIMCSTLVTTIYTILVLTTKYSDVHSELAIASPPRNYMEYTHNLSACMFAICMGSGFVSNQRYLHACMAI